MEKREYDIILYGASGYTASYIIKQLEYLPLNIAVAARCKYKIPNTMLPKLEYGLADIETLTSRTKILINCVGPYTLYGEPIIKACLQTCTHYIDICGEPGFLEYIRKTYHAEAKEKGIKIIQSAGFDSLPGDIGAYLVGKSIGKCDIEIIISASNCKINKTTWESLILSIMHLHKIKKDKNKSESKNKMAEYKYNDNLKSYVVRFRGSDPYIIRRSNNYFKQKGICDSNVTCYMEIGNMFNLLIYYFLMSILYFFCKYKFTSQLLLKHYTIFSLGLVQDHPSDKDIIKSSFTMDFKGTGLKNNKKLNLKIQGPDPGYLSTAIFISQGAVELIEEEDNITSGVLTPAIAFYKTRLVERLKSKGVYFDGY